MGVSLMSNPPYNMKHELPELAGFMNRYSGYTLPPESNANFAFVLSGLELIDDKAAFLLPLGVLSSSIKQEELIRRELIAENLLLAVIALPDSMFESTSIPTCVMLFDKKKKSRKISFIDLSQKYVEIEREQNGQFGGNSHTNRTYKKKIKIITEDVMRHCLNLIENGLNDDGLCVQVTPETVEKNDYNLSPGRYIPIETEPTKHRSFDDIANDYNRIIAQKNAITIRMNKTAAKRLRYDCMERQAPDLAESFKVVGQNVLKEENISFSAKDGIQINISTKKGIHPLIIDFLNHWRQMIIYLNSEENRYLAEFRDALLPELMSGSIEL